MASPKFPDSNDVQAVPPLSVVMPVHNAVSYLDEAIESVLNQSFADFEFVILDDASNDGSTEQLREWAAKDDRIRLIEVPDNLGPALSSDLVAREARAPIVARTDADDVCLPTRLEEQLAVLEEHPDVGVVGGLSEIIDAQGRQVRGAEPWRLARKSVFSPFGNGPMMYRRSVFDQAGGYRAAAEYWEDLDLILRMASIAKIMVIPHAIYRVRQSPTSTRFVSDQRRLERAVDLMYRSCERVSRGDSYEDLLTRKPDQARKIDPRVFISLGSVVLWAGGRPRLFRRLLAHGELGANFRTLSALIWTLWASLSPATLRRFLSLLLVSRNRWASVKIEASAPQPWKPVSREAAAAPVPPVRAKRYQQHG